MTLRHHFLRLGAALLLVASLALGACESDSGGDGGETGDTGSITGTVTADGTGEAIAGATIATEPATTTATTAADGTFSLDVPAGTYAITVTADGFAPKTRDAIAVEAGGTITLDFALAAGDTVGSIAGVITDADSGDPIEGATVATDPETTTATTGADGTYELVGVPEGSYTVTATADGYAAGAVSDVAVTAGEAAVADIALAMGGGQLVLTVENDCNAAALEGATVVVVDGASFTTDAEGKATLDLAPGEYTLSVAAAGFIPATTTIDVVAGAPGEETFGLMCQRYAVAEAARNFLADVTVEQDPWMPFIGAQDLFDNLNDGDDANDPHVLSVRAPDAYAIGHIPGATNIPWKAIAEVESIEALGAPEDAGWLAAYCYTGHTGGIATAILNMLGYRTKNLLHGMMSWTKDEAVRVIDPFTADAEHDFPVETEANAADGDYEPPILDFADVETEFDVIRAAASAYLNKEGMKPTISAQALFDNLNDGDDANDPFILSVRSPDDYAVGHIPGAVNIPWVKIALEENLRKLPTDKQIVVYCYTGHSGAIVTAILNVLGYDAVDLKFGIMSWTTDAAVRVKTPFSEDTTANDFAVEAGE